MFFQNYRKPRKAYESRAKNMRQVYQCFESLHREVIKTEEKSSVCFKNFRGKIPWHLGIGEYFCKNIM